MKLLKRMVDVKCIYDVSLEEKLKISDAFTNQSILKDIEGIEGSYIVRDFSVVSITDDLRFIIDVEYSTIKE